MALNSFNLNTPAPRIQAARIAVFRALQLGDLLCAVPAWRALRYAYPHAHIALISLPWAHAFVARFAHYIDEFIYFPGFPGLPEQPFVPALTMQFWAEMAQRRFDLMLQMHGNGNVINPMLMFCAAQTYAGFYRTDNYRPNPDFFLEYPDQGAEIHRHLRLMEWLGIPSQGDELEFPLYSADYHAFDALDLPLSPGRYVCIHPGARAPERRWDPVYFARLADACVEAGYAVVLTGVEDERPLTQAVAAAMQHGALDLAGGTSLGAVAVLIERSRLLIANDTGVSHLAAALCRESIILALTDEQTRWGLLDHERHQVVDARRADALEMALSLLNKRIAYAYR